MLISGVFSKEENEFVINNYSTMTQKDIANKLNRKEASIKDRIKKLGLSKVPKKFWTEKELTTLKHVYHRENDFMDHFPDRTFQSVVWKAWEIGIDKDGRGGYDVNHDYFKTMDKDRAYILGFIAADGNIYTKRHRLTITQHGDEIELLEKLKGMLESKRPIFKRKNGIFDIVITSREIVQDLVKIGFTDNKSLTLDRLNIPNEYMSHFVRGYFDGDGCASTWFPAKDESKKMRLSVSILGTSNILKWIVESAEEQAGINPSNVRKADKDKNIYKISCDGKKGLQFRDWIYQDADLYMKRKKQKFYEYEVDDMDYKAKLKLKA